MLSSKQCDIEVKSAQRRAHDLPMLLFACDNDAAHGTIEGRLHDAKLYAELHYLGPSTTLAGVAH